MKVFGKIDKLKPHVVSTFCYHLYLMQKSGINPEEGIHLLLKDPNNSWGKGFLQKINDSLMEGNPLSVALKQTEAFPKYMINMIEIGQLSGRTE